MCVRACVRACVHTKKTSINIGDVPSSFCSLAASSPNGGSVTVEIADAKANLVMKIVLAPKAVAGPKVVVGPQGSGWPPR